MKILRLPSLAALALFTACALAQDASLWPSMSQTLPDYESRIDAVMAKMNNADKVGQLVMGEIKSLSPSDLNTIRLGGILNGGGSFPGNNVNAKASDWRSLSLQFHNASLSGQTSGDPQIPVLWGTDAVHGHNNLVGATLFPHNIGLGATRNAALMTEIGEVVAREMSASGILWTFAPTIAVPQNDRWGRAYEGFSEDPTVVGTLGAAFIEGLQGTIDTTNTRVAKDRVAATAKHFVGDGGTTNGVDTGDTRVTEQVLRTIHGAPYVEALKKNVLVVMASFSSWNGDTLHGHEHLLNDVLKDRMGFQGFVLGDWNGHGRVGGCSSSSCAASINAGVDMIMVPNDWRAFYNNTLQAVGNGTISQTRLNDAVRRILRVKFILGLFDGETPATRTGSGDNNVIGSSANRAVARRAVRESLVLLKNNSSTLPLGAGDDVVVVGAAAQQIWAANGGWSVHWQGGASNGEFPGATSLYDGIAAAVGDNGSVTFSSDGRVTGSPDAAIVFFAENAYAEGRGDLSSLVLNSNISPGSRNARIEILERLGNANIPVISVYLGGRPLFLTDEINASDAFVAAWLPGTEGGGLADALFCDMSPGSDCDFEGKLPFSWPAAAGDADLNVGQANYSPLFAFDYGLNYTDAHDDLGVLGAGGTGTPGQPVGQTVMTLFQGEATSAFELSLLSGAGTTAYAKPTSSTPDSAVTARIIDRAVQEDAQEVAFAGGRTGVWQLGSGSARVDWSGARSGSALIMTLQVAKAAASPMIYSMLCGDGCQASLDISDVLRARVGADWFELAIPLSCLADAGANLSQISNPVALHTNGRWTINVSNTYLDVPASTAHSLSCP